MFLFINISLCKFFLNKKTNKKERELAEWTLKRESNVVQGGDIKDNDR